MISPFLVALLATLFALLNRGRGSRFWDTLPSTTISRLAATAGMAILVYPFGLLSGGILHAVGMFFWTWAALMFWCVFAWDSFWNAEIGTDPQRSRLWGLGMMALRMTLAVPCLIGLAFLAGQPQHAWLALATPLLGLPYYVFGYLTPGTNVIRNAELAVGALLGFLIYQTLS
jgi:hypothetical protein